MKLTFLFLREKAFSRLGICSFFGLFIWGAAVLYHTSLPPGSFGKNFLDKVDEGAALPIKSPSKPDPKRALKDVVVNI